MSQNRLINLAVGWTFILIGIAGLIFPVLQGILFLIVGLLFLSKEYHWANRLLEWLKQKTRKYFPRAEKVFESAERFLESEVHKMATDRSYFLKKIWLILTIILLLGLFSYLLALLFGWLKDLIWK